MLCFDTFRRDVRPQDADIVITALNAQVSAYERKMDDVRNHLERCADERRHIEDIARPIDKELLDQLPAIEERTRDLLSALSRYKAEREVLIRTITRIRR